MQLRFASFAVINLRRDLHPQECAHAGRTKKIPTPKGWYVRYWWWGGTLRQTYVTQRCWRRLNTDHLCRLNIDQGLLLT